MVRRLLGAALKRRFIGSVSGDPGDRRSTWSPDLGHPGQAVTERWVTWSPDLGHPGQADAERWVTWSPDLGHPGQADAGRRNGHKLPSGVGRLQGAVFLQGTLRAADVLHRVVTGRQGVHTWNTNTTRSPSQVTRGHWSHRGHQQRSPRSPGLQ